MITGDGVRAVADLAQSAQNVSDKVYVDGDRVFTSIELNEIGPKKEPAPAALVVHTLTGLRDYITTNLDDLAVNELVIHVVSPDTVRLVSKLTGETKQRFVYVEALAQNRLEQAKYPFAQYQDTETFIIRLLSLFAADASVPSTETEQTETLPRSPGRADVLKFIGNVRDEEINTKKDNGTTQIAEARAGIVGVERVEVPNPVKLAPYRTFVEIAQPESAFVFRVKRDNGIKAALFEADGGAWRDTAVESIKGWLTAELGSTNIKIIA